jgi:PhnB protein
VGVIGGGDQAVVAEGFDDVADKGLFAFDRGVGLAPFVMLISPLTGLLYVDINFYMTGASDKSRSPTTTPGQYGWHGGLGSSWKADPAEEMTGIILTSRAWTSPNPPDVFRDFWTLAYSSISRLTKGDPMQVQSYMSFGGRCAEALDFYRKALDAQVEMQMKFKDHPEPIPPQIPKESYDKIMHAQFKVGDTVVMATDGDCQGGQGFKGISLALSVATPAEAEKRFSALADGGNVQMPLTPTFFSPCFGMVADKFGVTWMVMAEPAERP